MVDITPSQSKALLTRILGLGGLALVLASLGLSMFTLNITEGGEGGKITLTPYGPEAKSSDLSADLRAEMPFDVKGLHATASWFAPAVGDGLDYARQEGGAPDLDAELTTIRIGMVLAFTGAALAGVIAISWTIVGPELWTKPIAIALLVAGGLVLVGWALQLGGMAAMADDAGDYIEDEGGVDADMTVGVALFLVPIGALAIGGGGVRGLLPERDETAPRSREPREGVSF